MALDDIRNERIKILNLLKSEGVDPYPTGAHFTHTLAQVRKQFGELPEKKEVALVGRVMLLRHQGGIIFFELFDGTGQFQGVVRKDNAGEGVFDRFTETVGVGDFVETHGTPFITQRGENSLLVHEWRILSKSIRPLPEKWAGLADTEERLRRRYLDLLSNEEVREMFVKKSHFWQSVRAFLLGKDALEVETPVLEHIPGGADAEPFVTHHKMLDTDFYLRISLELNLKRLLVGGYPKVFEIGRVFRNEGIDREHLQDYTQMECYFAYTDHEQMMEIVEKLYKEVIKETLGTLKHLHQKEKMIDWSPKWPRLDYHEEFEKYTGIKLSHKNAGSEASLREYASEEGIEIAKHVGRGRIIDAIFKKKVRAHLVQPSFLVLPPVEVEPLAKRAPHDPERVLRFQVMAGGSELGKGFAELNDPLDQRKRFEEQSRLREAGDTEAQMMDEEYIEALEYGMPPAAGFGMSERLFAFLMDKSVRETVFFPLMKPRTRRGPDAD